MKKESRVSMILAVLKKDLIALSIVEAILLFIEWNLRTGKISYDPLGTAYIFGNDIILSIALWFFGMKFYKRMHEIAVATGIIKTSAKKLQIFTAAGVCFFLAAVDTIPLQLIAGKYNKITAIQFFIMLGKRSALKMADLPLVFLQEFLFLCVAVLFGYGLGRLKEKFGTGKLLLGTFATTVFMEILCVTVVKLVPQTSIARGGMNVAYTYAMMHTSVKGDPKEYINVVDKEVMDGFFESVTFHDTTLAFPLSAKDLPDKFKTNGRVTKDIRIDGTNIGDTFLIYNESEIKTKSEYSDWDYINGIEIYPILRTNVTFGNGLKSNSTREEFFQVLGEGKALSYKLESERNRILENYVYTDGEGRYLVISYYYSTRGYTDIPVTISLCDELQLALYAIN
ncbi:MAG: hypothetical protein ACI4EX_12660 [Lachnospiraceae bacterium]